jgi:hypothetical protein
VNFHPDDPFTDYVDEAGNMTFGAEQAQRLDDYMEAVFGTLGDRVYDIGLEMMNAMRPEIDAGADYRENEIVVAESSEPAKKTARRIIGK